MSGQEYGDLQKNLQKNDSKDLNKTKSIFSNPTFDTSSYSEKHSTNLYVVDEAYNRMKQDPYRMGYLQKKTREESEKKERKAGGSGTAVRIKPLSEELKRLPGAQPLEKRGVADLPEDELLSADYDRKAKNANYKLIREAAAKMGEKRFRAMSRALIGIDRCDDETFRNLSAFMIIKNGEEANKNLIMSYLMTGEDEKGEESRTRAMDTITRMVFSIDVSNVNFKSDMEMVKNAPRLESIVSCVGAYDRLIANNPGYLDQMDPNVRKALLIRIDELRAVACYYLSRKDLLSDENYRAARDAELELELDDNSPDKQRALAEKIFNSYVLGRNLVRVNRGRGYNTGTIQMYIANKRSQELYKTATGLSDPDSQRAYLEKAFTSMDYISTRI
jgi:hypothetical protein